MSPRRPRRRARRRSSARPVIFLVAAAIVVALLIGGLTQISSQSHTYDADSNRALAVQGSVVADQSDTTSVVVRGLVANMQAQSRQVLQADLDSAVQDTAAEASRASLAASAASSGSVGSDFAAVFADRAQSMSELRAAVDGFLDMQPAPVAGSADAGATTDATTGSMNPLSATAATNRIAAAGALLARSDRLYDAVRSSLRAATGHGRLPASAWVRDPQEWQLGTVAAEVDLMATSPSLMAAHYLLLRTVRLTPPALPTSQQTAAGVSVLSPVSQVGVTVVLGNDGSVDEPHASVRFTLADQGSGASTTHTETVALALGSSVTLPTVTFNVKPGTTYVLNVAAIPAAGQTLMTDTVIQQILQVAPGT